MPRLRLIAVLAALVLPFTACDRRGDRVKAARAGGLPPVAVPFRWSATPDCKAFDEARGAAARCQLADKGEVAVVSDAAGLVVTRTGAVAWSTPIAGVVRAPVVAVVDDAVVVAALADDVSLTVLDLATGAVRSRAQVPIAGASAVQLERRHDGDLVRVHARTGAGGTTALFDPVTGSVLGVATTPAAAIVAKMAPGSAADGEVTLTFGSDTVVAGWEDDTLRVAAGGWRAILSRTNGPFRNELVTAHVAGDLVVGTIHHPSASWTQAFAISRADGAIRWRRTVTGLGPVAYSAYLNRVSSRVVDDALVVQGVESGGAYVCTLELATGRERACVDGLSGADVIVPADPGQVPGPRPTPPRPLGPRTTSVRCTAAPAGPTRLSARRSSAVDLTGMITTSSDTCALTLSGGIVGDRIELQVADDGAPAASPCECQVNFRQDYRPETTTLVVLRAGAELTRLPMPAW